MDKQCWHTTAEKWPLVATAKKIRRVVVIAESNIEIHKVGAFNRLTPTALLGSLLGANGDKYAGAVMGTEDIMKPKAHGACPARIFCQPSVASMRRGRTRRHAPTE